MSDPASKTELAQAIELVEASEPAPTTSTSNSSTAFPFVVFVSCVALIWNFLLVA
jgi:hypothetical protein